MSTTNLSEKLLKSVEIANTITVIDIQEFVLKNPLKLTSDLLSQVANQLFFYNKIKTKVPLWYENKQLVAPPKVSIEQCSSQFTAQYKASLCAGTNGLDLTGGMGVDSYFLSKNFKKFIYNEPNSTLFELAKYNFSALNLSNIIFNNLSANAFLTQNKETFDLIYIDPSRRDLYNNKKIKIEDCEPNLKAINTELLNSCQTLMVKYSPMLDIKNSIKSLLNIHKIIILADKNEVKELLFILIKELNNDPEIVCVNQTSSGKLQEFKFLFSAEEKSISNFANPKTFLFEPNASILKAGAFKSIGNYFSLEKLAPNSHLYTSDEVKENFPGRTFKIINICNFDKKEILKNLPEKKANLSCRNFHLSPEEIKKKLGITEGGEKYVFFTENIKKQKLVLICEKYL